MTTRDFYLAVSLVLGLAISAAGQFSAPCDSIPRSDQASISCRICSSGSTIFTLDPYSSTPSGVAGSCGPRYSDKFIEFYPTRPDVSFYINVNGCDNERLTQAGPVEIVDQQGNAVAACLLLRVGSQETYGAQGLIPGRPYYLRFLMLGTTSCFGTVTPISGIADGVADSGVRLTFPDGLPDTICSYAQLRYRVDYVGTGAPPAARLWYNFLSEDVVYGRTATLQPQVNLGVGRCISYTLKVVASEGCFRENANTTATVVMCAAPIVEVDTIYSCPSISSTSFTSTTRSTIEVINPGAACPNLRRIDAITVAGQQPGSTTIQYCKVDSLIAAAGAYQRVNNEYIRTYPHIDPVSGCRQWKNFYIFPGYQQIYGNVTDGEFVCAGSRLSLRAADRPSWTTLDGIPAGESPSSPNNIINTPGEYRLTVYNRGCPLSLEFTVVETDQSPTLVVDIDSLSFSAHVVGTFLGDVTYAFNGNIWPVDTLRWTFALPQAVVVTADVNGPICNSKLYKFHDYRIGYPVITEGDDPRQGGNVTTVNCSRTYLGKLTDNTASQMPSLCTGLAPDGVDEWIRLIADDAAALRLRFALDSGSRGVSGGRRFELALYDSQLRPVDTCKFVSRLYLPEDFTWSGLIPDSAYFLRLHDNAQQVPTYGISFLSGVKSLSDAITIDHTLRADTLVAWLTGDTYATAQWQVNGQLISETDTLRYVLPRPGDYELQANRIIAACSSSAPPTTVNYRIVGTSERSGDDSRLIAFPNPSAGRLNWELRGEQAPGQAYTVQLLDALGRQVFTAVEQRAGGHIEVGRMPAGIYSLRVQTQDQPAAFVQRIIITR